MKPLSLIFVAAVAIAALAFSDYHLRAANGANENVRKFEYATIRWNGLENTHVIRPGGEVEFIGTQLSKASKPNRADNRSFYVNLAMNALAKEGYDFAGISGDDIIMKRAATR